MKIELLPLGNLWTNCYLLRSDDLVIIIDPAATTNELFKLIGTRGIDMIINTHGHFDHVGGNSVLKKKYGAKILLHRADLPLFRATVPPEVEVDRFIDEGDKIGTGAETLEVLHMPGHSPGSIILVGAGVIFCGDLIFAGSIGRTDFPGGSSRDMTASLQRLAALPGDYTLYPGHGPTTTLSKERALNPFLNMR
ncbi:MBL fold metallo-hydrolase [Candidatus Acetothermia bacterium]|nr:MBL fold metallo-hydrolase [Candidatus Acetothermia bacterium]MCI2427104.1 MBL fold metallo-hydrolase [Candidatus Acetothermia bacterium]MCI2428846.1 MBL fold metallo-hydrolase [Candidatus Acetothermia bacterium]